MTRATIGRKPNGQVFYLGSISEKKFQYPGCPFDFVCKTRVRLDRPLNFGEEINSSCLENEDIILSNIPNVPKHKSSLPSLPKEIYNCQCLLTAPEMYTLTFATHKDDPRCVFILKDKLYHYRHEDSKIFQKWARQSYFNEHEYKQVMDMAEQYSVNEMLELLPQETKLHRKLCQELSVASSKAPFVYENVNVGEL